MITMPMKERKPISSDRAVSPSDKENNKLIKLHCNTTQPSIKVQTIIDMFFNLTFETK